MSLAYFGEELCGWTAFALTQLGQPLTDAFTGIGCGGEVEQALVSCGVLQHSLGLAVDGEDDGALRLLELADELDGVVAEGGEGLDVLGDVDPCWHSAWPPLQVFYRTFGAHGDNCSFRAARWTQAFGRAEARVARGDIGPAEAGPFRFWGWG